jgi:hypothetical protein
MRYEYLGSNDPVSQYCVIDAFIPSEVATQAQEVGVLCGNFF